MAQNSFLPSRPRLISACLMIVLGLVIGAAALYFKSATSKSFGTALIGGPFTMLNHKGETVTDKTYLGSYTLVFFGFSNCGDVCPTELQVMAQALGSLGSDAEKIIPLFVTVDPERDTPQVLLAYLANFDARLQGLTGSAEQLAAIAKAYHIFYKKVPNPSNPNDYEMDHPSILYLMGPDGKFVKHFAYTTDANSLGAELKKVLQGS